MLAPILSYQMAGAGLLDFENLTIITSNTCIACSRLSTVVEGIKSNVVCWHEQAQHPYLGSALWFSPHWQRGVTIRCVVSGGRPLFCFFFS